MKILIVMIRWKGGVGRVISGVKKELEAKGHKVEVISREDDLNSFSLKNSFFKLRKEVKKRDYDILYTQDWSCAVPFLFKRKHYCCFHGHNFGKGYWIQSLIGKFFGKKLIVVSKGFLNRFPKANIIYNAADNKEFYNLNKERKYIGYYLSNRTMDEKDPNAKLVINVAEALSKEKGLEISVAKNIPPEKMNEWYNSLKYFICLPPKQAGFMLCWLEAKLAGVTNIVGNNYGVGLKNIELYWKEMTWKNYVNKLMKVFKDE